MGSQSSPGASGQLEMHLVKVRGLMDHVIAQGGFCLAGFLLGKMDLVTGSLVQETLPKALLFHASIAAQPTLLKHRSLK